MANNIVNAVINCQRVVVTRPLYQYDYGMQIRFVGVDLDPTFQVHFSNTDDGESVTQIGTDNVVTIPDAYLETGETVYCWVYVHTGTDDGETVYKIIIPVYKRARPTDIEPLPEQADLINQLVVALNSGISQAEDAADRAEHAVVDLSQYVEQAHGYAQEAEQAADAAIESENEAKNAADQAGDYADSAISAKGTAERAASSAETSAQEAASSATAAQESAETAKQYGVKITIQDGVFRIEQS